MATVSFTLNGTPARLSVDENRPLLWVLRDDLGLTGTKFGCGEAVCGACTVLVDDEPVRACATRVREVQGRRVTTIEGLARDGRLHPLQAAFVERLALQCGYCTPGMIMSAAGLLAACPQPSEAEIVHALEGNLCRCTGYVNIVKSVQQAAETMAAQGAKA